MEKIRDFVVIVVKTVVSGLVAWLAARQIDVPQEVAGQLEAVLTFAGIGLANWLLNLVAPILYRIPGVGELVKTVWPLPAYTTPGVIVTAPPVDAV